MRVFDLNQSTPTAINVYMEVEVNNPTVFSFTPLGKWQTRPKPTFPLSFLSSLFSLLLISLQPLTKFYSCSLGDLQFFIQYQGFYMGTLYAVNTNIYSGANLISMFGSLTPKNMTEAGFLISRYFSGLSSTVSAVSTKNASSIILYDAALSGLELSTVLEGNASALVSSVKFVSLSVLPNDNSTGSSLFFSSPSSPSSFTSTSGFGSGFYSFRDEDDYSFSSEDNSVILDTVALVTVANPLGNNSPITILNTSLSASLIYEGNIIGSFETPLIPIFNGSSSTIQLEISSIMYLAENGTNFELFLNDFVYSTSISTQLVGNISVYAETAIGVAFLEGLPLNNSVVLNGLQGLPK
jgi:hypothetical protein